MLPVDVIIHKGKFGDDGDPFGITSLKSNNLLKANCSDTNKVEESRKVDQL